MKLLKLMKDGGPESHVYGFFLIEIKSLFSIVLLRFADGSREAFHSHAFNAVSWLLKGRLEEDTKLGSNFKYRKYWPSFVPILTPRTRMHKVASLGNSYVLTFRGPWAKTWEEYLPDTDERITLTHGRQVISRTVEA